MSSSGERTKDPKANNIIGPVAPLSGSYSEGLFGGRVNITWQWGWMCRGKCQVTWKSKMLDRKTMRVILKFKISFLLLQKAYLVKMVLICLFIFTSKYKRITVRPLALLY